MKKSAFRVVSFLSILALTQMMCSCGMSATVTVGVYEDLNSNGKKESGEPWMPGVPVTWLGITKTTDANGTAQFPSQSFSKEKECIAAIKTNVQPPQGYKVTQPGWVNLYCYATKLYGFEFFESGNQNAFSIIGLAPIIQEAQTEIIPASTEESPAANPALTLTKTVDHTTCLRAGEQFNYTYIITNTGNTPLTGPFNLIDNKIPTIKCEEDLSTLVLQPNESATCTGIYFSTDIESQIGAVIRNEAVVTVLYNGETISSNTAVQEVFCKANPPKEEDAPTEDPCLVGPPYPESCPVPPLTPEG